VQQERLLINLKWVGIGLLILAGFLPGVANLPASAKEIDWQSFENGIARGKTENKKIYLHFYANWCGACRIMESKTFRDPTVITYLNENFIPIKVNTDKEQDTSRLFRIRALPDNWFIAEDGKPIGHQPGYIQPALMKKMLKRLVHENSGQ
jgi:thiol:disulfide interchange protein